VVASDGENAVSEAACFICGGKSFRPSGSDYQQCVDCGHETLLAGSRQGFIVNDPLTPDNVKSQSGLDRFKNAVLSQFDPTPPANAHWVDVGSASGKYLYQNRHRYSHSVGLEITAEAVQFSRVSLNLNIVEDADALPQAIHVATAWHSLEHFPAAELGRLLGILNKAMNEKSRFIVSVPNAGSRQYKWFGSAYAFFDVPHHLHQFSQKSLDLLMARHGFIGVESVVSWPYNVFGYTQGLLNLLTGTHNYLYYRLKRKSLKPSLWLDLLHVPLLPLLVPTGAALAFLDSFNLTSQGVITKCYKRDSS